jgi:hypothetical protein
MVLMKKIFTDEQSVGILRGFEVSGKTIEVVAFIRTRKVSERRVCRPVALNRKSCRYQKRQ